MGNENLEYNRDERIKNLEKRSDELGTETLNMYNDKKYTTQNILDSWDKKSKIDNSIKRLKKMDENEKNFDKNKDNWDKIEKVGTSKASDKEVKDILFGKSSEEWTNKDDYHLIKRNCQDYSKEKINQLTSDKQ